MKVDLYQEILSKLLKNEEIHIVFPNLTINPLEIIELACYKALQKIKTVIEDDNLKDNEYFIKIEEIVAEFEKLTSSGSNRHDF